MYVCVCDRENALDISEEQHMTLGTEWVFTHVIFEALVAQTQRVIAPVCT